MSGIKFKVGDRVNWLGQPTWQGVKITGADEFFDWRVERSDGEYSYVRSSEIEHAAAAGDIGPVRTVTRREIVAGRYGIVYVGEDRGVVCGKTLRTAAELREAARIFNEIADVLDESAKEAA